MLSNLPISSHGVVILFHLLTSSIAKEMKDVGASLRLQCPPCEQIYCTPRNPQRLKCAGGITTDVCNCCPICAKLEGERCGGDYNYAGKCDTGLFCESVSSTINDILDSFSTMSSSMPLGICKRKNMVDWPQLADEPSPTTNCKAQCTPEFCTKNPRAICSASQNHEEHQSCQGDCQHTSCRACHYVDKKSKCKKCGKDDFKCLKRFGRCMKKDSCSREKYFPCGKNGNYALPPKSKELIFECVVPECLDD